MSDKPRKRINVLNIVNTPKPIRRTPLPKAEKVSPGMPQAEKRTGWNFEEQKDLY